VSFVMSDCPSAGNSSASTGRISLYLVIENFSKSYLEHFSFIKNSPDLAPVGARSGEYGGWNSFRFPA
jgi:hypothetical protein